MKKHIVFASMPIILSLIAGRKAVTISDHSFLLNGAFCPYNIQPDTEVLILENIDLKKQFDDIKWLMKQESFFISKKGEETFEIKPQFYLVDSKSKNVESGIEEVLKNLFNTPGESCNCLKCKAIRDLHQSHEMVNNLLHKVWPKEGKPEDLIDLKNEIMQLVLRASQNIQFITKDIRRDAAEYATIKRAEQAN